MPGMEEEETLMQDMEEEETLLQGMEEEETLLLVRLGWRSNHVAGCMHAQKPFCLE